jgi:hypothetical protein
MPTVPASAGGDLGSIAVPPGVIGYKLKACRTIGTPFSLREFVL